MWRNMLDRCLKLFQEPLKLEINLKRADLQKKTRKWDEKKEQCVRDKGDYGKTDIFSAFDSGQHIAKIIVKRK